MIEYTELSQIQFKKNEQSVVAIGFFDGLHLAHQTIVHECVTRAHCRNRKAVVFTFQNHPSSVLTPEYCVPLLSPYPLKKMRIETYKIDALIGVLFNRELSEIQAEQFVEDILIHRVQAKEIVVGYNFHFGHQRKGSAALLQSYVPHYFDEVKVVDAQNVDGNFISSSAVRKAIQEGRLDDAACLLGRRYQLYGEVVHGDGRGATIGFPTANVDTQNQLLPPNGIYGVRVWRNGFDAEPLWGAMNIGVVPTFAEKPKPVVEVHILDHHEELYGQNLIVEICHFVREERKFDGIESLVAAINHDIEEIRNWIENHNAA